MKITVLLGGEFKFEYVSDGMSWSCRRNENTKILAKELLAELQSGTLDV